MHLRKAFVATLLGCTMLAGCDGGSDDKANNDQQQMSTFGADIAALKQAAANNAAGDATTTEQTNATNVETQTAIGQIQVTLTTLSDNLGKLSAGAAPEDTIKSLKESIATLQVKLTSLTGGSTSDSLASLAKSIQTLQANLESLGKTSATADALAAIKTALDTLTATVNTLAKTSATAAALAEAKATIAALQAKVDANQEKLYPLVLSKMPSDQADVATKLPPAQTQWQALQALKPQVDKLVTDATALQAPPLASDPKFKALVDQINALKADFTAATADDGTIAKTFATVNALLASLAAAKDVNVAVELADELAAAPKSIDDASKVVTDKTADFTARIASLDKQLEYYRPRVDVPLTQFVNLFIGTQITNTGGAHSGNDTPGAQTPFGMVSFGPDTRGSGDNYGYGVGGYYYTDGSIDYFSMIHVNGPGCRGGSAVAMLPLEVATDPGKSGKSYKKQNESAAAGFYKAKFDNGILTELTATTRTGMMRVTYADATKGFFLFDASRNGSNNGKNKVGGDTPTSVQIGTDGQSLSGQALAGKFCDNGWKQPVYYYLTFDKKLKTPATITNNANTILQFDLADTDKTVNVKVGISSVSVENAKLNLDAENANLSFDAVKDQSSKTWNARLNAIQLDIARPESLAAMSDATKKAGRIDRLTQFYTALYRTYGGPTVFSDVNGDFRSMQQVDITQPFDQMPTRATTNTKDYKFTVDGKESSYGAHYASYSLWDTYRSLTQLIAVIAPEASDMMQSLVVDAQQCGALPRWVYGSENTSIMQGDFASNAIAGSYAFGARNFDIANAQKYVLQGATDPNSRCNHVLSVGESTTKQGLPEYLKIGYISPSNPMQWNPVSSTTEMVDSDRSAATFLQATGDPHKEDIQNLFIRANNWTKIFNDDKKKLIQRNSDGTWGNEGVGFHEGTEPQYIWNFSHDWTALIGKLGGTQKALDRLNALFSFDASKPFKGVEPSASQLNSDEASTKFNIGNELAFSTPWAYNWAGSPKYAQYVIPLIMRKTFNTSPQGLPGNDDLGATSGWYVLAALGLYPAIPSAGGFAVSTPQFGGITVWLANGSKLRIAADQEAMLDDVRYISEMKLNDVTYQGSWLPYDTISKGGKLSFTLSKDPTEWGAGDSPLPPSGPNADYSKPTATPVKSTQIIQ